MKNSKLRSFLFLSTLLMAVFIFSSCAKENGLVKPANAVAEIERPTVTFIDTVHVEKKLKFDVDKSVRIGDEVPSPVDDAEERGN